VKALLTLRRRVVAMRDHAHGRGNIDKVYAFNSVLDSIERQLKFLHDRNHDRKKRQ
jgi:hypothetical protein